MEKVLNNPAETRIICGPRRTPTPAFPKRPEPAGGGLNAVISQNLIHGRILQAAIANAVRPSERAVHQVGVGLVESRTHRGRLKSETPQIESASWWPAPSHPQRPPPKRGVAVRSIGFVPPAVGRSRSEPGDGVS